MAYMVQSKQKQRRERRTLNLDGEKFPPLPMTVGLDRQIRPLRAALDDAGTAYAEQLALAAGRDTDWEPLEEMPTAKERRAAGRKAEELHDAVVHARAELIVAALDKGSNDSALTAEVLVERLEIADITAFSKLLFDDETVTIDDRPTGDSDVD